MGIWDDYDESAGADLVIPKNHPNMIENQCKILRLFEKDKAAGDGKFPCMELKTTGGRVFLLPVWTRDAKHLIKQWGPPSDTVDYVGRYVDLKIDPSGAMLLTTSSSPPEERVE